MTVKPNGKERRPLLAICTPGSSFSVKWRVAWDMLLLHACGKYRLNLVYGCGNNVYQTRSRCVVTALENPDHDVPDYVLWIDSDNPPSVEGFDLLMATLEACPEVAGVSGWYRYGDKGGIAAGMDDGDAGGQISEKEIIECYFKGELFGPIAYTGFGFFLTRGKVLARLGSHGFDPLYLPDKAGNVRYLMDDCSYCRRMRDLGFEIYIHPAVFVEHEKFLNIPAPASLSSLSPMAETPAGNFTQQKGAPAYGNRSDARHQQEEL